MQIKHDDLQAKYLELKDELEEAEENLEKSKNARIVDEHAAYELYVRRTGGTTISGIKAKVDECLEYARRDGHKKSVLENKIAKLSQLAKFYEPIFDKYTALARLVDDGSSSSAAPPSSSQYARGRGPRDAPPRAPDSKNLLAKKRGGAEVFARNWLFFSLNAKKRQEP
jgi:hypothetical protein